jgi:CDP-glucose 4,6-dehydratase
MGQMVTTDYLSTFKGRRIFITGHTGFKGSWLAFLLNEVGAEVLGYALPPVGEKNHFDLLGLAQIIGHVEADIRDEEKLTATMSGFKPEFVFHLAAQALVWSKYLAKILPDNRRLFCILISTAVKTVHLK